MPTLEKTLSELYRLFKLLNKHFYGGKLQQPVLVVQSKGKHKNALGWCTTQKIWRDNGNDAGGKAEFYEISISAEFLHLPVEEIIDTLLHEMVHLFNLQEGVQDCSRGNTYHNKFFRDTAAARGLNCKHVPKYGWAMTSLTEDTKKLITSIAVDDDAFRLVRAETYKPGAGGERKGNSKKYSCPACSQTVRATKTVAVLCGLCMLPMVEN